MGTTTAVNVLFSGAVNDSDGNLSSFSITARRSDQEEISIFSNAISGSLYPFAFHVNFTSDGTFYVKVTAQDHAGNITISNRTVVVDPTAGAGTIVTVPTLSPFGGKFFVADFPITVTAACATSGATIYMQTTSTAVHTVPGGGWTATTSIVCSANQRVWCYATHSGLTTSSAMFADFLSH